VRWARLPVHKKDGISAGLYGFNIFWTVRLKIAIQGELGSNSHMAALSMLGEVTVEIVPCAVSSEVLARVVDGDVDGAVLPIENSLHGSVAEHYDLFLDQQVRIVREGLMHIRHNLIALPGVGLEEIKRVISHPVALSQCRRFLAAHPEFEVMPFYDTAGSVKHVMREGLRDVAGVAPELAARQYGGNVLVAGIEDHAENYTRFYLVERGNAEEDISQAANKMSVAFTIEHRPGTLVAGLQRLAVEGVDLTRIESRPVPGSPWEYVFYVDVRFRGLVQAAVAVAALREHCRMVKVLGFYVAA
jgi:prephenate dehydratase